MSSFASLSIIDVAFKLTVHGLVFRQLYHGLNQYVIPMLRELVQTAKDHHTALVLRHDALLKEKMNQEKQLADQSMALIAFEKKIHQWQQALEQRHEQAVEEKKQCFEKLYKKRQEQELAYQKDFLKRQVVEYIRNEAVVELAEQFEAAQGKQYIHSLITRLKSEAR